MLQDLHKFRLDRPAKYRIKILGRIDSGWREWFDEMQIQVVKAEDGETITTLTGTIQDQSALHGLLAYIRDRCLPLLQVQNLETLDH